MRRIQPRRDRPALALALCCAACPWALPAVATGPAALGQVPGPEIFDKEPTTPLELWDAADYLVRTGQVAQAVPYLTKLVQGQPDDDTLLAIRDRYGARSILRLDDYPETRPLARALADRLAEAARRNATRPERIGRFVAALTKTTEEQEYAVDRLREAGPYAVPALIKALNAPALPAEGRVKIVRNLGRLDRGAVPPLIATLDSPDTRLAADAARALARIGDARAVPQLTCLAAQGDQVSPARAAARRAILSLTGRPFDAQPRSPVRVLTDEARRYHLHRIQFPGDSVIVWDWDETARAPAPRQVSKGEAEAIFGLKYAREALRLDPADVPAQVALLGLAIEKAVERVGFPAYPADDPANTFASALAAGPDVLGQVVRTAIADGKDDLAAAAVMALGRVTDREALATDRRVNPLVEALTAPSRRVQFAAARAIVALDPRKPFPGSSQVVPVLARFVTNQPAPRAVVIDGNANRGGQLAGFLKALGYDPMLAPTGDDGFRMAAESADVELIVIDCHLIQGDWRLVDTVSNLRADARTAGIPLYVVGPLNTRYKLIDLPRRDPGVKFLVTPTGPQILEQQLGGRPSGLSDAERAGAAHEAAMLLALIAARPGNPFEPDLVRAEPALAIALGGPTTGLPASSALGDVPDLGAQRGLADVVLDPSRPAPLRRNASDQLARSIQRFGPLVTSDQEAQLFAALPQEGDPALRMGLASILGALHPEPGLTGIRLRTDPALAPPAPGAAPTAAPAANPSEAPGSAPGPAAPPAEGEGGAEAES
ncbi:MAG TPA: HEAT repeat domain-containing protein [Isosphaeraceae bacterium]|nr:HEAT repeat domain-containing protein [Isosphaeraceae bacterium]